MLKNSVVQDVPEPLRQEIFRLLVVAQDFAMTVAESREMVVALYGLSEHKVHKIENEGLRKQWPPL